MIWFVWNHLKWSVLCYTPNSRFYTPKNDDRFYIQKLSDFEKVFTIRFYFLSIESGKKNIYKMIKASDEAEIPFRDDIINETNRFFHMKGINRDVLSVKSHYMILNIYLDSLKLCTSPILVWSKKRMLFQWLNKRKSKIWC